MSRRVTLSAGFRWEESLMLSRTSRIRPPLYGPDSERQKAISAPLGIAVDLTGDGKTA